MKNLLNKWIFIAQFRLQDSDPDSEYRSGSSLTIWIRIHPDPDPQHCRVVGNLFPLDLEKWIELTTRLMIF